ncbi:hypothetical protein PC114_g28214 [Phytophthora cactorum]|nr:hypothetical protein PC114_g28214 [Phytophthora cactorum]
MLIENPVEELSDDGEDEDIRPGAIPRGLMRMVDEIINEAVAQRLEGVSQEYLSNDSMEEDEEVNFFEQEVLHTVNINGIPPHKLTLKKGLPS